MTKKLNFIFSAIIFLFFIYLSIILALNSGYNNAVKEGINLWVACVIPSLFPYLFITSVLSHLQFTSKVGSFLSPLTKRTFNCSGAVGYAFLISTLSGYPLGAKTISDLKLNGVIDEHQAVRGACACSSSSPMFLISSVGAIMFCSRLFGLKLFAVHLVCTIINGFIFSFYKRNNKPSNNQTLPTLNSDNLLYDSVYSAVISILVVGGLITIFYLLTEVLLALGFLSPIIKMLTLITGSEQTSKAIVLGTFECTKGLKALSVSKYSIFTLPICASICGFGGFSVIAQSIAYLKKAKIKTAPFLLSKVTSAVLNFIIGLLFSIFSI